MAGKFRNFIVSRPVQLVLHMAFWAFFIALPFLLRQPDNPDPRVKLPPVPDMYIVLLYVLNIPIFYLNAYFLIPNVLKNKGVGLYILSVAITIAVLLSINLSVRSILLAPIGYSVRVTIYTLFPIIFLYAVSTSYRVLSDYIQAEQRTKELENEKLRSELSFLRSQISPHFMFNVLNSLVSLARKKSDLMEPMVIRLSDLMRYMLYESDETKVTLEKEIRYLQSYIDLQKLRFGDSVKLSFRVEEPIPHQTIEPMLLIPFVENAFKHGTGMIANPVIEVFLEATTEDFTFRVTNKLNTQFKEIKDKSSGIGLANVQRRLSLLYPDSHQLTTIKDDGWFTAELKLKFKQEPLELQALMKKVA
ncbi:MAG: sensor histidine kinase [Spirosomataceae bacterium]